MLILLKMLLVPLLVKLGATLKDILGLSQDSLNWSRHPRFLFWAKLIWAPLAKSKLQA
jgi:hypothetical protein